MTKVQAENRYSALKGLRRRLFHFFYGLSTISLKTVIPAVINILALSGIAQGTSGTVQLIVEDSRRAKKALDEAKLSYQETTAEEYQLPNKPGALAQYLDKLAAAVQAASGSTLINTARVSSSAHDFVPANNAVTVKVSVN